MTTAFKNIGTIKYEGPASRNPLSFKHYNAEEIVEGKTGHVFQPRDTPGLVRAIEDYFAGEVYAQLKDRRREIQDFARDRYSWTKVGQMTMAVYARLNGK